MNLLVLVGRLTKDSEVKKVKGKNGDRFMITFRVAESKRRRKEEEPKDTLFLNCHYFVSKEETADKLAELLAKGTLVSVSGRLSLFQRENESGYYYLEVKELEILKTPRSEVRESSEFINEEEIPDEISNAF